MARGVHRRSLGLGLPEGWQEHGGQNSHYQEESDDESHPTPALTDGSSDNGDEENGEDPETENGAARFAEQIGVEFRELLPGVIKTVSGAPQDGHGAAESGKTMRRGDIDFPLGIGVRNVCFGGGELE